MAVFTMSCGWVDHRFGDEWMTEYADTVASHSHISRWWSSRTLHQVSVGDTAVLCATGTGKVMGAYEIVALPVHNDPDDPHPRNPAKWSWTLRLRPLVLLDGSVAPTVGTFGLTLNQQYKRVDPELAKPLLAAIHPALKARA